MSPSRSVASSSITRMSGLENRSRESCTICDIPRLFHGPAGVHSPPRGALFSASCRPSQKEHSSRGREGRPAATAARGLRRESSRPASSKNYWSAARRISRERKLLARSKRSRTATVKSPARGEAARARASSSASRKRRPARGSSGAFALAVAVVLVWAATGPVFHYSDTWQLVINTGTTVMTFLMVFLIQRSQNKDSQAVHLKLNEIVAALEGASNRLIDVESMSEAELQTLHAYYQRLVVLHPGGALADPVALDRRGGEAGDPEARPLHGVATRLGACHWCRRRESNPHGLVGRGILSPLRLPFRHSGAPRSVYRQSSRMFRCRCARAQPAIVPRTFQNTSLTSAARVGRKS